MSKNNIPFYVVDAFTQKTFSGNPAAIVILQSPKPDEWLQKVAAEFNLSETAFLWLRHNNEWQLRWFTPRCEVKLCGHATLAAAHVLIRELRLQVTELVFSTLSDQLSASIKGTEIYLDFPKVEPSLLTRIFLHDEMNLQALGFHATAYYQAGEDIIIELNSEIDVGEYRPDIEKIARINTRGIILTAPSDTPDRDFVSRFFAPRAGINEDPVTGSAHCSLGVLWSRKLNKHSLRAEQLSSRRGDLKIEIIHDRVHLIGNCVTFSQGHINATE